MLELMTRLVLEVADALLCIDTKRVEDKRSGRAYMRVYWTLLQIEGHSEMFIDGLRVVQSEGRFPVRVGDAVGKMQNDVHSYSEFLIEEHDQEEFRPGTGFWGVLSLYDQPLENKLIDIVGERCARLRAWIELIDGAIGKIGKVAPWGGVDLLELSRLASIPEGREFPVPDTWEGGFFQRVADSPEVAIQLALDSGNLEIVSLSSPSSLVAAIQQSEQVLTDVRVIREGMAKFIREHFTLNDLL